MFRASKQSGFIPLLLTGILFFSAVSAEAGDHHHRRGERAVKGAVIGAVAGTLFQIIAGRTEGDEILAGAVVGGTLGAAVGAKSGEDRYHDRYRDDYYYEHDGYYTRDSYPDDGYWDDDQDRYEDWYGDDRYDRDEDYYRDHDDRYEGRGSHRHDSHCNHHR
jgi:hypothetical protein